MTSTNLTSDHKRLYVTTPIYYVNDKPHIGHAYCTVLADAARRYHQLLGCDTYFLTGTDEHGQKVQEAAQKRGIDPQQHCDELHQAFKAVWVDLDCQNDQFIRTTEPRHKIVVQKALQLLWDKGLIEARDFEGWYSVVEERFVTDKEMADGGLIGSDRIVRLKERNYFFLMSKYQDDLRQAIASKRIEIIPHNRANEVLGFLNQPLQDLCISRPKARLSWGIEFPKEIDQNFVTYVWFDALLNYATAVGFEEVLDGGPGDQFWHWWPSLTHFLGKDILTTHAVYWPTMLMGLADALGQERTALLPRRLVTTGWWLVDDTKMSKSLGNVVSPLALREKYGTDVLRYFLLREMPVGQDSNFSEEALIRRNNADLANDLGNLLQRTVALVHKYFEGKVPVPGKQLSAAAWNVETYKQFLLGSEAAPADLGEARPLRESILAFRLHRAVADTMGIAQRLNQLLTLDAPFKTVHTDREAAATTLFYTLDGLKLCAALLVPVLPATASEILRRLGVEAGLTLHQAASLQLIPGTPVLEGPPLFPKFEWKPEVPVVVTETGAGTRAGHRGPIERSESDRGSAAGAPAPAATGAGTRAGAGESVSAFTPEPTKPDTTIDVFAASDLRIGTILHCEPVPKSKKLLRLEVDLGEGKPRQILSGVAESFAPADLIGQQALFIANLPPRLMMGLESHGMMLVASDANGKRVLMQPARAVPASVAVG